MSCGKTHTRRQVHQHRRQHVMKRRGFVQQIMQAKPKRRHVTVVRRRKHVIARRKFKFNLKQLQAWERKHPFKNNANCHFKLRYAAFTKAQMAEWFKKHPFKPYTQAQISAYYRTHPFKKNAVKKPAPTRAVTAQKSRKPLYLQFKKSFGKVRKGCSLCLS